MKFFLKNSKTNLFARADGDWVLDAQDATDFKVSQEAISFCDKHHLFDTSLITSENGMEYELPLKTRTSTGLSLA